MVVKIEFRINKRVCSSNNKQLINKKLLLTFFIFSKLVTCIRMFGYVVERIRIS